MIAPLSSAVPPVSVAAKSRRIRLLLGLHLLVALLSILLGFLPFPAPDARWQIRTARFQLEVASHAPADEVALPHNWLTRGPDGTAGFYRVPVNPAALARNGESLAIFIPRFTARVDVLVNGRRIASSGGAPSIETVARNTSLLAPVPAGLWRPYDNLVEIRIETRGILSGFLDRLYIGPEDALRPAFEARTTVFILLPALLAIFSLVLAGLLLVHWLRREEAGGHAVLALALLLGSLHALNLVPASPLYSESLHRALHAMPVLEAPLTAIAVTLMLGHRLGHPLVYLVPGVGLFLLGLFGNFQLFTIGMVTIGLPIVGFFLGLIVWLGASIAIREGHRAGLILSLAGSATLLLWLHDLFVVTNIIAESRIVLARLFYPLVTSVLGAAVVIRLIVSGNGAKTMQRRDSRP